MRVGFGRTVSDRSLRPARWSGRPRGHTLLRVGLVAALLGLAAAVLHTPPECAPPTGPGSTRAAATPSPAPTARSRPLPRGTVGVPVRLAEPAALTVVRPGDRVDLLAVSAGEPSAGPMLIAPGVLVLDVVDRGDLDASSALYLALPPPQARRAVGLPDGSRFAVIVRG